MKKTKTLFIGTSEFAVPILEKLSRLENIDIAGIVTQPDRPAGRHQSELVPPTVKAFAISKKLKAEIFQPEKLKTEAKNILEKTKPELVITASYAQMIPKIMLDYPKLKALNVHASLLPELRGAVPVPMAILQGEKKTGVTIQIMAEKLDEGPIIDQKEIRIDPEETAGTLTDKLSKLAADQLENILPKWIGGKIKPKKQDNSKATYCFQKDISKEKAMLLGTDSAIEIDRKVRAFNPWPIAWAYLREASAGFAGKRIKIFKVKILNKTHLSKKNLKFFRHNKSLILRADTGWLEVLECQVEGKNIMSGKDALFLANDKLLGKSF